MKDTEIMKALNCCQSGCCGFCPMNGRLDCKPYLSQLALDLIQRQQERMDRIIERLEYRLEWMKSCLTPVNSRYLPHKIEELERVIEIVKGGGVDERKADNIV